MVSFFFHFFFDSTFLDIPLIPHNSLCVKNKVILNNCGDACECIGNIDGDKEVGALDLFLFNQEGRRKDCTQKNPCNGDLDCDTDVDALDVLKFIEDFLRNRWNTPCPTCDGGNWCVY